jgi:hypothetical protein
MSLLSHDLRRCYRAVPPLLFRCSVADIPAVISAVFRSKSPRIQRVEISDLVFLSVGNSRAAPGYDRYRIAGITYSAPLRMPAGQRDKSRAGSL